MFVVGLAIYAPKPAHAVGSTTCSSSADFDVSANPHTLPLAAGATGASTFTFTPLNGFTGTITLTLANVDSNLIPSLSTDTLDLTNGPKTAILTVTASNAVTAGNYYSLDVNATAAATLFHDTTISVHVPSPEIGISPETFFLSIPRGSMLTDIIHFQALHGLADQSVGLTQTVSSLGSPTPPMASLSPSPVTLTSGVAVSTLTVTTTSSTSLGFYQVKVSGATSTPVATNSTDIFVTVTGPTFGLEAKTLSLVIAPGSSKDSTINVTSIQSFAGTVGLTTIVEPPIPTPPTATLSPPSVALTAGSFGTSVLTVRASPSATPGSYSVLVTGTSGSDTNVTFVSVTIPGPGFFLDASPAAITLTKGSSPGTSTIDLGSLNGFADTVNLSISCDPGLTASLSPGSVPLTAGGTGSATLTVSTYAFTVPGDYSVDIFGASTAAYNLTSVKVRVTGPGFTLSSDRFLVSLTTGDTTTATITATSILGFTGPVSLAAVVHSYPNPSTGLTATLSPSTLTLPSAPTSTLTLTASAPGSYFVAITGTSWPLTNETGLAVDVTANTQDFTITASSPSSVTADGTSVATSTITINPLNGFTGTVSLSHGPLQNGLTCQAFNPATLTGSGARSSLSCKSTVAGSFPVTVTGTSGTLIHPAIAVFTFTSATSADFTVNAHTPVTFVSGSTATSSITVAALAGFYYPVALSSSVSPSTGLSVTLNPQSIVYGSGSSTATFSSSTPGSYTVTITGTYGSQAHTATVQVTVTASGTGTPDVSLSTDHSALSFNSGTSATTTITVAPQNGFSGTITLDATAPTGVSCSLSSTNIQTSGTSTLTCSSSAAGDYTVTVTATGGASPHTTTVNVHVAAVSPAAPAPSTILGLDPTIFYGIIAVIIVVAAVGTVLVIRSKGSRS